MVGSNDQNRNKNQGQNKPEERQKDQQRKDTGMSDNRQTPSRDRESGDANRKSGTNPQTGANR